MVVLPDAGEVVTVEGTSEEGKGRRGMMEGLEVVVEVGWMQMRTRIRGEVVGVAKELEVGREGRVMPEVDGVVMGGWSVGNVREVERDGIRMAVI